MTPKEKAEDLFLTYFEKQPDYLFNKSEAIRVAKEYALIAVDEIVELCEFAAIGNLDDMIAMDRLNYWDKVKQEIEKL